MRLIYLIINDLDYGLPNYLPINYALDAVLETSESSVLAQIINL